MEEASPMRPVLKMLMRGALLMLIAVSAAAATPDQRGVGASHLPEDVGIDIASDAAANVVGAKDVGIEHAGDLVRPA